jgi:4-hydroxybenzoate polyprenyltransferase
VFCLSASAIYLLNDIADIAADRQHHRKRFRPFAAGTLSIPAGAIAAGAFLLLALAISSLAVSVSLTLIVLVYVAVTSAYSLVLKRRPVADVFALTGLYVLRIVAGGVATGTVLSSWLLAFALFFFLSLAFVKRYAELIDTNGWIRGRGYGPDDVMWMHAVGTTAGYMAVLVLALYVTAPEVSVMYGRPQALWLLCPILLFWITRLWFRAGRRAIHDDPVVEAIKDPMSYAAGVSTAVIVLAAL